MSEVTNKENLRAKKLKVAVLLATFKPNLDYLEQQLISIVGQTGVEVKLYWSDDSGSNHEYEMIKSLIHDYDHTDVTLKLGNMGVNANFLYLLKKAEDSDVDYYAFADQDDIWESDKLFRHATALIPFDAQVAGTHSTTRVLERGIQRDGIRLCQNHELKTLVEENCFQGCTMMINCRARDLILELPTGGINWYDWWIGCIISIAGKAVFVDGFDTVYRLHGGNLVGIPSGLNRVKRVLNTSPQTKLLQSGNLLNFAREYGYESAAREIEIWINGHSGSISNRLKFALTDDRRRKRMLDEIARRFLAIRR